jgi:hypothetical protein
MLPLAVLPWLKYAKWGISVIILSCILFAVYLFYNNYNKTLAANAQMKSDIEQLNSVIIQQQRRIEQVEFDSILNSTLRDGIALKLQKYTEQQNSLRNKFEKLNKITNERRDIGKLADAKPKLLEKIVNKGSDDFKRCIEIASGAPLTKDELDAIKPSQINSSCPELANPNYKP